MTDGEMISLREHISVLFANHKELIEQRFFDLNSTRQLLVQNVEKQMDTLEKGIDIKILAQEKAVSAAFIAYEKAVIKAEESQKDYNIRSNEFRGQLDDQAKLLMSRSESLSLHSATSEKIEIMRSTFETKLETQRIAQEKVILGVHDDITQTYATLNTYYTKTEMDGRIREFFAQVDNAEKARTLLGDRLFVVEKFTANIQGRFYAFSIGITIVMTLLAMISFFIQHITAH